MIKKFLFILVLSNTVLADYNHNKVDDFINYMYAEHSYSKENLRLLFGEIKSQPRIKKYFKKAPERTLTWDGCKTSVKNCTNYKKLFVTKKNINAPLIAPNILLIRDVLKNCANKPIKKTSVKTDS